MNHQEKWNIKAKGKRGRYGAKRVFALALTGMLLVAVPIQAVAAECGAVASGMEFLADGVTEAGELRGASSGKFHYRVLKGGETIEITSRAVIEPDVVIPEEINGFTVTSIGEAAASILRQLKEHYGRCGELRISKRGELHHRESERQNHRGLQWIKDSEGREGD